jgi:hypothetical protein
MNLAARDRSSGAEMRDIARKLKFSLDGSATRISLRLTQQELERTSEAFAESHKAPAQLAGNAAAITAAPADPPSEKPAMIRIEGLDEGPREIPYKDGQH